jgi:RNA polymerase sigma-70 factor (ECF subfamily)
LTDADLVRRAREGDDSAYDALMKQHQEAVFRFAYLLLGDRDEADDLAQETFIRAFRMLARFDLDRPFRPWVLKITANLAANRRRAAGRYMAALRRWFMQTPTSEPRVEQEAIQNEQTNNLWEAVRRLNQTDQEVIYLRYFLELSEADAADALGVAVGTVKSRLHRALARLRTEWTRTDNTIQTLPLDQQKGGSDEPT